MTKTHRLKLTFSGAEPQKFSQWGEEFAVDQILQELFPRQDYLESKALIEFGASKGPDNSNFWKFKDVARLLLIEANEDSFEKLRHSTQSLKNAACLKMRIGVTPGVDNLLSAIESVSLTPAEILGVSIDIDSDDAAVFEAMGFTPPFAIVEFNPTLPFEGRYRNPPGKKIGNNIGEILAVGEKLGMFPVGLTKTNVILCDKQFENRVERIDVLEEVSKLDLPRFGWGYDGTLVCFSTNGADLTKSFYHNGWSGSIQFQPVPAFLRGHQDGKIREILRFVHSFVLGFLSSYGTALPAVLREIVKHRGRGKLAK